MGLNTRPTEDEEEALLETVKREIQQDRATRGVEVVSSKIVQSDNYHGVEINISGDVVSLRPVLDAIGRLPSWRVESLTLVSDIQVTLDELEDEVGRGAEKTKTGDGDESTEQGTEYTRGVVIFCPYFEELPDDSVFI